ncbi:MAG: hypothetical protein LAO76_02025 [Acidobacteriia bacterium]|nr:hypothetical protein [Terriglobia bacterium]
MTRVAQWQSAIPGRWFPGKTFFVGGEDESYFTNLEMQVSIPAAAFAVSSKKGRQE